VVVSSDDYWHADLIGGLAGQFTAVAIAGAFHWPILSSMAALVVGAGFAAGVAGARLLPGLRRVFIGRQTAETEVYQRALQAFFENGLTETRDRTGVLIFVSLLERRVRVIADAGIDKRVPKGTWDQVVNLVLSGVRSDDLAGGLAAAVDRCGDILSEHFPKREFDYNELPDDVRME
jgi:putative membrane protein